MAFFYILPQSFLSFVTNFFWKKSKQHLLCNMNLSQLFEKERGEEKKSKSEL